MVLFKSQKLRNPSSVYSFQVRILVDYSYGFQMKQNAFIFFGQNLETPTTVWWWQVVEEGGNSLESCRMRGL